MHQRAERLWVGRLLASATGVLVAIGLSAGCALAQASGPDDPQVRELIRMAEAREPAETFCARLRWAAGNYAGYKDFLDNAKPGSWKANTFKGGENCQYDRIDVTFNKSGTQCVSYTFWACNRDDNCSRGNALTCKNRKGEWETENVVP